MPPRARRVLALPSLLALAIVLASCGDSHTRVTSGTYAGESGAQAPYLDVGSLIYEVQLSRQLNPLDVEDSAYLQGLAPVQSALGSAEEWFVVFVQVYNNTSQSQPPARSLTISDTQGNVYKPLVPNATNPFAYRAEAVPPKGRLPLPDSIAAAGPSQGAMLLYKIKVVSLDNRPLTITIANPENSSQKASAELDV